MATVNSPTGPHPSTATERPESPARSWRRRRCRTAPAESRSRAAASRGSSSRSRTPAPRRSARRRRRGRRRGSRCARTCGRCRCGTPSRLPQVMWLSAETKSPTATCRTSAPTSTTVPANSWPSVTGGRMRPAAQPSQRWMWRSVPQTLAASTSTTTSVAVGRGSATSSSESPGSRRDLAQRLHGANPRTSIPLPGILSGMHDTLRLHGHRHVVRPLRGGREGRGARRRTASTRSTSTSRTKLVVVRGEGLDDAAIRAAIDEAGYEAA